MENHSLSCQVVEIFEAYLTEYLYMACNLLQTPHGPYFGFLFVYLFLKKFVIARDVDCRELMKK